VARSTPKSRTQVDAATLERILDITRELAAPFELDEVLKKIIDSGRDVLSADRGTVFLFDAAKDELVVRVATGIGELRIPAGKGIAGECAKTRKIVNVPDAYADERFNREIDRESGYHTRCILAVPLIGHDDTLVGVLQLLNKTGGAFDERDERIAAALAAQCAVALQRVRLTQALLAQEKMERELALAREIQMGFLPRRFPSLAGYDLWGTSRPADATGGDTFDMVTLPQGRAAILLGDATGHGVGPALSATQVRAMLRIAMRLSADLGATVAHINDQLEQDLASNRFVTAFVGLLDTNGHEIAYHAAGQGPLMHFHAAEDRFEWKGSTTLPLGFMSPLPKRAGGTFRLDPGDIVALLTDGVFECEDPAGKAFGEAGVESLIRAGHEGKMADLGRQILSEVDRFVAGAPQADDITVVLVRRLPAPAVEPGA
jgi:phosphoserine phosphatase